MKSSYRFLPTFIPVFLAAFVAWTGFALGTPNPARAEPIGKHPRVAELEDKLAKDASLYLRGRFPELPFLVTVSIDPLRRQEGYARSTPGESLPYFESASEELQDEWDDPQISWGKLMMRVRKAAVAVSLPGSISDDEVAEVKDSLFQQLNLTPARDEITLTRKSWSGTGRTRIYAALIAGGILLLSLLLFFIGRSTTTRLAAALAAAAKSGASPASPSAAPASAPTPESPRGPKPPEGGMQFSDPLRVREVIAAQVRELAQTQAFPGLDDMIELDTLGMQDAAALGAVLSEFPEETRARIFALSEGRHWLEALLHPGQATLGSLEAIQRLGRRHRDPERFAWENLLILVWRLGDDCPAYIRGLPQDQALTLLGSMPKSISVPVGRKVFPGAWGSLLATRERVTLDERDTAALTQSALTARPLRDRALIDRYRQESELLEYLRVAEIAAEREIYGAADTDSLIHSLRPPFFRVLEATPELRQRITDLISIDQWALALFNAPRPERLKVEEGFNPKQRFLLVEKLKNLDAVAPTRERIGLAKEAIARVFSELAKPAPVAIVTPLNPGASDAETDDAQAA